MYWNIGELINDEILQNKRAEYGKEIVATVSQQLSEQYGKGYSYSALTRMMKFSKNMILKDPYLLDFLEINDRYLEKILKMQF